MKGGLSLLSAINRQGQIISLVHTNDENVLNQEFFCPTCYERLIVKKGSNRRWHFSHYHNSNCGASESESEYHLNGKLLLYEWIKGQNISVELEKYFSNIKQRADLCIQSSPFPISIEFQCATIRDELFLLRTKNYFQLGAKPLWILGGNRLNRLGKNVFRLRRMDWLALHERKSSPPDPFLLYFCPTSDQFALLTNIIPYSSTKIVADLQYINRKQLHFQDLFSSDLVDQKSMDYSEWHKVKTNWRIYPYLRKTSAYFYVNRMLQNKHRNLPLFPPEAGMPTKYLFWIETPPYLWQTWLLVHCVIPQKENSTISFDDVYQQFKALVRKQIFRVRNFPLLEKSHYSFAIMNYLLFLCKIGILRKVGKRTFNKINEIQLPSSIDDALKMDEQFQKMLQVRKDELN